MSKKTGKRFAVLLLIVSIMLTLFSGCGSAETQNEPGTVLGNGRSVLRIVSGSENAELEPILQEFADRENVRIEDLSGVSGYYASSGR